MFTSHRWEMHSWEMHTDLHLLKHTDLIKPVILILEIDIVPLTFRVSTRHATYWWYHLRMPLALCKKPKRLTDPRYPTMNSAKKLP